MWAGFIGLRWGPVTFHCEQGDEPSHYIKFKEVFDKLSNYGVLKNSATWN